MQNLKTVMHAHSLWSYDGRHSLQDVAKIYGRLGVNVVMMSEHDTGFEPERFAEYRQACLDASTDHCRLIPGIEYSCPDNDIHILTWGMTRFLAQHRPVIETLQAVHAAEGVAILAHPIRRAAYKKVQPEWFDLLNGIELWNRKSDGISWGQEALALLRQTGLPAFVGHDFHRYRQIWPLVQLYPCQTVPQTPESLEATLVKMIQAKQSIPTAFGCRLDVTRSTPGPAYIPTLEKLRKHLRKLRP